MPPSPRKAPARGRRNPELLNPVDTGDDMLDQHIGDEIEDEHGGDPGGPEMPENSLLFDGDIVTCNATLAVDTTGNGKTDFVGYRATTRVQPGEDHGEVFSRVVTVVGDGVLSAAIDVSERWAQYEQVQEEQRQQLLRVTGKQQ